MNKIRVVHHSKTVGFSGTDKAAQLFCKYLNKDRFEPFIVYRDNDSTNTRLDIVKSWIGDDHVIPYNWVPGKKGKTAPYLPEQDNFADVLAKIDPHIVHCHYSGYNEWPSFKYLYPKAKWIGHNIFGFKEQQPEMDLIIYIADYVRNTALKIGGVSGPILYNPIEMPTLDVTPENRAKCRQELISHLKLPPNSVLLGRVGRADNFDPISLKAFSVIEKIHDNVYYLVVNPCQGWHDTVKRLGIQNVRFLSPIVEDDKLSKFYMGLDIYAHARSDGEMCPTNIQEAMMHGLPVISHESPIYNGQSEILASSGFVVPVHDHDAYRDVLLQLVEDPEMIIDDGSLVRFRSHFAREARRRAMREFEASIITSQLEKIYERII